MHSSLADPCSTGVADSNMVPDGSTPHDYQGATDTMSAPDALPTPTTFPESPPDSSHNMADLCIVCLEDLKAVSDHVDDAPNGKGTSVPISNAIAKQPAVSSNDLEIAVIKPCGHCLHDDCLREWTQKANSCPFCRQTFNLVEVFDKVGGKLTLYYLMHAELQGLGNMPCFICLSIICNMLHLWFNSFCVFSYLFLYSEPRHTLRIFPSAHPANYVL
jgi:hypothetical protein